MLDLPGYLVKTLVKYHQIIIALLGGILTWSLFRASDKYKEKKFKEIVLLQFLNETQCIGNKNLFIEDDLWVIRIDLHNLDIMLRCNFFSPVKHQKLIYELMELYRWIVNHDEVAGINNLALIIRGETPVREMVLFYSREVRNRIERVREMIKKSFPEIAREHKKMSE
ncbi:MAG: hypothetical protein ACOX86_02240 [Pelotomaculaceae bacterium]|jgi:hypothetical protein|uniref:Uncharacterized protein n=1 Tax=anaerobic digester metagenome TaxID=1263854 RepID=A0A485LWM2_9ZZZZ|nr:hypothetical protein [Bacillota bacterium]HHU85717.1 hypothetical protein [Peptococcaceae bacterium]